MNLPIAPIVALLLGGAAAVGVAAMPQPLLEGLVMDSGIPAVMEAAAPPLGNTARVLVASATGMLIAVFAWLILFLLLGTRAVDLRRPAPVVVERDDAPPAPVLRRADAHPDAPARAPLLATRDLGMPFLEPIEAVEAREPGLKRGYGSFDARDDAPAPAEPRIEPGLADLPAEPEAEPEPVAERRPPEERPLPRDLDQPLAAFDPDAVPEVPIEPPVTPAPHRRAERPAVFEPNERFETFELTPVSRPAPAAPVAAAPDAIAAPQTDATIHALLERLERGVARRAHAPEPAPPPADPDASPASGDRGLEAALLSLRKLAQGS